MKKNISISSILLMIMLASILILLSCKGKKTARIISDKVVMCSIDSIGWRTPQWDSYPSDDVRLIDIKCFNDTIFLFHMVKRNDSMVLLSYFWDDQFYFLEERKLKIAATVSEGKVIRSIAAIAYDTMVFQKYRSIELYIVSKDTILQSFHVGSNEVLTSNFSPVQYCSKKRTIYSEYLNYDKINESNFQTMRYCEISTVNNKLNELSIIEPEGGKFQSLYAKTHFVLTKNDIVVKYNFVNEFEKFDIFRKRRSSRVQIAMSDKIQSELPDHNEPDPDFSMSYLRSNPIQMGLMFNKELDKTILVYSMPLPQRKEDSLMPSALDKPLWIISFDSELQPTEKLIIDKPGFWATMCYSVENKIFLVSNREIYTITL